MSQKMIDSTMSKPIVNKELEEIETAKILQDIPAQSHARKEKSKTTPSTIKPALTNVKMKGSDWLSAQPSGSYVLQLIGAVEMATIKRFLQFAELDESQLALYTEQKSENDWHVLVYGLYADLPAARLAIASLPPMAQAQKPWPKTLISIQETMKSP